VRAARSPLQTRLLHPHWNLLRSADVDGIAELLAVGQARRIIVMSGAGISTAAGIPDFRSPDTGLYANLQKFNLPYAEAIFDIDYFQENPQPFYALARELYPGNFRPTLSHYFIRLLATKGLLLRNFTQNIDTLERVAGLADEYLVEAHGSFHTAHCTNSACRQEYSQDWVRDRIMTGMVPICPACVTDVSDSAAPLSPIGYVKPDITFFGEALPPRFFEKRASDFTVCDLLIVMGTSLQVQPFASLIDQVSPRTPRLLINREVCGVHGSGPRTGFDFDGVKQKHRRDALYLGSCDDGCLRLAELLGWKDELLALHASEHTRLAAEERTYAKAKPVTSTASSPGPSENLPLDPALEDLAHNVAKSLHIGERADLTGNQERNSPDPSPPR
ncbi:hypothetical protein IWQ60_009029, partial [Tieghemiomyces parasiticus]